jgi:hypothetical protein
MFQTNLERLLREYSKGDNDEAMFFSGLLLKLKEKQLTPEAAVLFVFRYNEYAVPRSLQFLRAYGNDRAKAGVE